MSLARQPSMYQFSESPVHLGGDPLPGVLGRAVQHRRPGAVGDAPGALGQLQRDDLATLVGVAEHHELDQLRVVLREAVELVADAPILVPRPPDVEPGRGLLGSQLPGGLAVLVLLDLDIQAARLESLRLARGEHDVDAHAGLGVPAVGDVEAGGDEFGRLRSAHVRRVHVQGAGIIVDGIGADWAQHRERQRQRGDTEDQAIADGSRSSHDDSLGPSPARRGVTTTSRIARCSPRLWSSLRTLGDSLPRPDVRVKGMLTMTRPAPARRAGTPCRCRMRAHRRPPR